MVRDSRAYGTGSPERLFGKLDPGSTRSGEVESALRLCRETTGTASPS